MVQVEVRPGLITVIDPIYGRFEFDGLRLAQLENVAREQSEDVFLPYQLDGIIPGFDRFYDRLPGDKQTAVYRKLEKLLARICNATIAGDLYPLMLLTELASLVAHETKDEDRPDDR